MQRMKIWKKQNIFFSDGLELDIPVVDAMSSLHCNKQPGIVTIKFESKEDKIKDLEETKKLKDSGAYSRV